MNKNGCRMAPLAASDRVQLRNFMATRVNEGASSLSLRYRSELRFLVVSRGYHKAVTLRHTGRVGSGS